VGVALASPDGGLALVRVWRFHLGDRLDSEDARFLTVVGVDPPRGAPTLAACAGRSGHGAAPRHGELRFLGFHELSSSCPFFVICSIDAWVCLLHYSMCVLMFNAFVLVSDLVCVSA